MSSIAVFVGEDHRLQHVDDLGDVGHLHAVVVLVEDVEREAGEHGVAERVLLVEAVAGVARLDAIPGAPFVGVELDPLAAGRRGP